MVLLVCPIPACWLKFKGSKKLSEHWRKMQERLLTLYTFRKCKKTFSYTSKAAPLLRQVRSQHWSKEIEVTNRNFMDPGQSRY